MLFENCWFNDFLLHEKGRLVLALLSVVKILQLFFLWWDQVRMCERWSSAEMSIDSKKTSKILFLNASLYVALCRILWMFFFLCGVQGSTMNILSVVWNLFRKGLSGRINNIVKHRVFDFIYLAKRCISSFRTTFSRTSMKVTRSFTFTH